MRRDTTAEAPFISRQLPMEISVETLSIGTGFSACISIFTSEYNPYPTAFPYGNGMVLHFYQQQESSTTKTVHKVINKGTESLCIVASHW